MPWIEDSTYEVGVERPIPIVPIIVTGGSIFFLLLLLLAEKEKRKL